MSVNKVILLGRLARDPELRQTHGGMPVCNMSIATDRRVKKGETWESTVEWHRVQVWGKTAERCGQYLAKGREVFVEGRLQTRTWQDKAGNKRSTTDVVADYVQFIGGRHVNTPPVQSDSGPDTDDGWGSSGSSAGDDTPSF